MNGSESANGVDEFFSRFLKSKGYMVSRVMHKPREDRMTFVCESDEMEYYVKLIRISEHNEKVVNGVKNEVAAMVKLWELYPEGETESFLLPPGPEVEFHEEFEGTAVYGYARFYVDGTILGSALRNGSESFTEWADTYANIVKTIDTLPDLNLPRTAEKKDKQFEEEIVKNMGTWKQKLETRVPTDIQDRIMKAETAVSDYFKNNRAVTGTVHGELVPDQLVFMKEHAKPTVVQFSKLCQWYPRFWDIGQVYSWVKVVLGDSEGAHKFWDTMISGMDKSLADYVKIVSLSTLVGTLAVYTDPMGETGTVKISTQDIEGLML